MTCRFFRNLAVWVTVLLGPFCAFAGTKVEQPHNWPKILGGSYTALHTLANQKQSWKVNDLKTFHHHLGQTITAVEKTFLERQALGVTDVDLCMVFGDVARLVGSVLPKIQEVSNTLAARPDPVRALEPIYRFQYLTDRFNTVLKSLQWTALRTQQKVGVEIEITPTLETMTHLSGGPIKNFVRYIQHDVPEFLYRKAKDRPIEEVTFDELSPEERYWLLAEAAPHLKALFGTPIPGVKLSDRTPRFALEDLDGKELQVLASDRNMELVGKKLEDGLEFKFLFLGDAYDANLVARKIGRQMMGESGSQEMSHHTHTLEKVTLDHFSQPKARRLIVDFWRRANIVAELFTAAKTGRLERTETPADPIYSGHPHFNYLSGTTLALLDNQLWIRGLPKEAGANEAEQELSYATPKMTATGWRSHGDYVNHVWKDFDKEDQADKESADTELTGWETRWMTEELLDSPAAEDFFRRYLKAIQKGLYTKKYHFPEMTFDRWYGAVAVPKMHTRGDGHVGDLATEATVFSAMHYNQKPEDLFGRVPAELGSSATPAVRHYIATQLEKNLALGMLLHDWSFDPLFYFGRERLVGIRAAQKRGLESLGNALEALDPGETVDESISEEIIRQFVARSGLLPIYSRSIGMESPFVTDKQLSHLRQGHKFVTSNKRLNPNADRDSE